MGFPRGHLVSLSKFWLLIWWPPLPRVVPDAFEFASVLAIGEKTLNLFESVWALVSDFFSKGEYFTVRINRLKPIQIYIHFRVMGDDHLNSMREHLTIKISRFHPCSELCFVLTCWQEYSWIRRMIPWQVAKDPFHSMAFFLGVEFLTKSEYVTSTTNYSWEMTIRYIKKKDRGGTPFLHKEETFILFRCSRAGSLDSIFRHKVSWNLLTVWVQRLHHLAGGFTILSM